MVGVETTARRRRGGKKKKHWGWENKSMEFILTLTGVRYRPSCSLETLPLRSADARGCMVQQRFNWRGERASSSVSWWTRRLVSRVATSDCSVDRARSGRQQHKKKRIKINQNTNWNRFTGRSAVQYRPTRQRANDPALFSTIQSSLIAHSICTRRLVWANQLRWRES